MDKQEVFDLIKRVLIDNNIEPSEDIFTKLDIYYNFLIEYNKSVNLTALTTFEDVYVKHFADCIAFSNIYKHGASLCDIGTGAGFPGIIIKIIRPDIKVTLVDSLNKRIVFLEALINKLALNDIYCLHYRAEDLEFKNKFLNKFDYVVARAVAAMPTLTEYCLPYVKTGGQFIAYKSNDIDIECNSAKKCINILGGKLFEIMNYKLTDEINRSAIVINKTTKTDFKYPRGLNKPRLNPII